MDNKMPGLDCCELFEYQASLIFKYSMYTPENSKHTRKYYFEVAPLKAPEVYVENVAFHIQTCEKYPSSMNQLKYNVLIDFYGFEKSCSLLLV
jgi:hypothetical protein